MALIECKECKNEISDQAVTCPHCGMPQNAKNRPQEYEDGITRQKNDRKQNANVVSAISSLTCLVAAITTWVMDNKISASCFILASIGFFIKASKN